MTGGWLFVFRPSVLWTYCGGATLVCANSVDGAIALANGAGEERITVGGRFVSTEDDAPGEQCWVLETVLRLGERQRVGVLFYNANYACSP